MHAHMHAHMHTPARTQAPRPRGTQQNLDAGRKTDLFDRSAAPAADGAATNCRTCVNDSAHSCPDTSRGMGGADLVSVPDPEPEPEPEPEPAAGTSVTEAAWTLYTCSEWTADILAFRPGEFGSVTLGAFTSLAQRHNPRTYCRPFPLAPLAQPRSRHPWCQTRRGALPEVFGTWRRM